MLLAGLLAQVLVLLVPVGMFRYFAPDASRKQHKSNFVRKPNIAIQVLFPDKNIYILLKIFICIRAR